VDASEVERIVHTELDGFVYEPTEPGTTVGVPWSEEKIRSYLPKLRAALIKPYRQRFAVRDTWEQIHASVPIFKEYWVVAQTNHYIQFFDPTTNEFGLAQPSDRGAPVTIGVRGDLVGVFCAM